jgi:hypothetical protein
MNGESMQTLLEKTKTKEEQIRSRYKLISIWEHEFDKLFKFGDDPEINTDLRTYLDDLDLEI